MAQGKNRLARLRRDLRNAIMEWRRFYFNRVWGMNIGKGSAISFSAKLDMTNPAGIHIGEDTAIVFGATILSHDMTRNLHIDTRIGSRCSIGAHSIIMPGVTVGDGSIVSMGSVVMRDVPPGSIVFGLTIFAGAAFAVSFICFFVLFSGLRQSASSEVKEVDAS